MDKTEGQILQTEKNHVLYDKALLLCKILCTDRRLFLFLCCFAYKYSTMISSVSDSTCAMIPNDQILSLTARKRQPPRKPSTVFRVRVHALFEWQNCPKVAFAFAFVLELDAFAFALFINGPLELPNLACSLCSESLSSFFFSNNSPGVKFRPQSGGHQFYTGLYREKLKNFP